MKLIAKISLFFFCLGILPVLFLGPRQASADLVDEGKDLLLKEYDIYGADAKFAAAQIANPADDRANFWRALTIGMTNPGIKSEFINMGFFDAGGNLIAIDEEDGPKIGYASTGITIIDNQDTTAGYSETGTGWTIDTTGESYGDDHRAHAAGVGANKAKWTFTIPVSGEYEVTVWWPSSAANSTDARFTIFYDNSSQTVIKNLRDGGGNEWERLGRFHFTPGIQARVELSDNTATGQVTADAVKLELREIFLDSNEPPAILLGGWFGSWVVVPDSNARNGSYREIVPGTAAMCTWPLPITLSGRYHLDGRWQAASNNATAAVFQVRVNNSTIATIPVDQTKDNLDFVSLGVFDFQASDNNEVRLLQNADGRVTTDGIRILPIRTFTTMQEFQDLLTGSLNEGELALSYLNSISPSFQDTADFGSTDDLGAPVMTQLDYGDALIMKAIFNIFKSNINLFGAYDMDSLDGHEIGARYYGMLSANGILAEFPNFLGLSAGASSRLATAKQAFINGINGYFDAYNAIIAEADDQDDDFVTFDSDYVSDVAPTMHQYLNNMLSNLNGSTDFFRVKSDDLDFFGPDDSYFNMRINLRALCDNPTGLNSLLPDFDADDQVLRSTAPDPTLGGILPDVLQEHFNGMAKLGSIFAKSKINWNGDNFSITLNWKEDTYSDFTGYKIFRSTTDTVDETSTKVYDSTDKNTLAFTDIATDPNQRIYYYRLYTYYDDGDKTASQIMRVITKIYVDAGASGDEKGSKEEPYSELGEAIDDYGKIGCKFIVAQGTYFESDTSLHMWGDSGVMLEGGYESGNWTRNIALYETILDGTGGGGYQVLQFNMMNGGGIDGFTITNGSGLHDGCAIGVWRSTDIKIKNCKFTNCRRGIGVWENSSASIEDCSISQMQERALDASNNSSVQMKRVSISNCPAAISGWSAAFNLNEVTVSGNGPLGGASPILDFQGCSVTADKLTVSNNNGYGSLIRNLSTFDIRNSRFSANTKDGFSADRGYGTLFNCLIDHNTGAGVYVNGSNSEGSVVIDNITSANNTSHGVITNLSSGTYTPQLKNSILANNGGYGLSVYFGSLPTVSFCDMFGNTAGSYSGTYTNGGGNITNDPVFAIGPDGNYYLSQTAASQAVTSACVDAGSTTAASQGLDDMTTRTDKHGDTGTVDMGYHYETEGIIVDNTDPNTSKIGTWTASTSASDYYGSNYQYCFAGTGANKFTWLPAITTSGTYEVFARWTASSNRATNAKYTITNHTGSSAPVEVSQQINNGTWVSLGKHSFLSGGTCQISLNDNANGVLIADAVKLVYVSEKIDLIVDNADPNTSKIGTWTASTGTPGYYGSNYQYRFAGTGANKFTWLPAITTSGTYEVFARWTSFSNRATNAKYTITNHTGSSTPVEVSQQINNGVWISLGKHSFQAGGTAQITLSDSANNIVIADAVKLVYISPYTDIVVDNTDPNTNKVGTWTTSTSTSGYYGSNYQYLPPGTGTKKFIWLPDITTSGTYEVYARWVSYSNRATNAKYSVTNHTGTSAPAEVNQQINSGIWVRLGKYSFQAGGTAQITLTDNANGIVIADAVKLVYISPSLDMVVDNTDPNTSKIGTWTVSSSTPGYYGSNYQYRPAGTGTNKFTWLPNITTSGTYEVFARWTSYTNRATNAKYVVTNHTGTTATIEMNQQINNGIWISLGKHSFQAGGAAQITLSDGANNIVIADAVRLTQQ